MNQTYVGCFGEGNSGVDDFLKANDIESYYQLSVGERRTKVTARDFVVAVQAKGGQANDVADSCKVLAVDRLGRKLIASSSGTLSVDANNTCWP